MNIAVHKAVLRTFRQAGIAAGESLDRLQLLEGFLRHYRDPDALDEALRELVEDAQLLDTEDLGHGPYVLTEGGYRASLNDW